MIAELDIGGVFLPVSLVAAFVAVGIQVLLRLLLERTGFYRLVWHRALFDLALFVILWGAVVALSIPFGGAVARFFDAT